MLEGKVPKTQNSNHLRKVAISEDYSCNCARDIIYEEQPELSVMSVIISFLYLYLHIYLHLHLHLCLYLPSNRKIQFFPAHVKHLQKVAILCPEKSFNKLQRIATTQSIFFHYHEIKLEINNKC